MSNASFGGFRPRNVRLPLRRGTIDFGDEAGLAVIGELVGDAPLPPVVESAAEDFVGVTTDGSVQPGLYGLADEGFDPEPATAAARAYLGGLPAKLRDRGHLPMDAVEWRRWSNAFLTFEEHGLQLQELDPEQRDAALSVIEASVSSTGFAQTRNAMRLNAELGEVVGGRYPDTLTEYCYWFTLFGDVSTDGPWGWQLQGHHVDLHCVFVERQMVLTPTFLGCELDGQVMFAEHRTRALELMSALDAPQRDRALQYGSMVVPELPHELAGMVDGRHRAGAGYDNLVLPYAGLSGDQLRASQRELLLALADPYLASLPEGPRTARRKQVERNLDNTHLAWIGTCEPDAPFYYRLHSPVVLIEYDNHAGIFLDNDQPEPFHVHTIVRSPNGGDYGKEVLRQHYAHSH